MATASTVPLCTARLRCSTHPRCMCWRCQACGTVTNQQLVACCKSMQPTRFAVFHEEPRHASHCMQLGKPRTLVGGGAGDSHRRPSAGSLTDGNGFGGYGAENVGPWAHPNKRRRSSRSNSNISSQGERLPTLTRAQRIRASTQSACCMPAFLTRVRP